MNAPVRIDTSADPLDAWRASVARRRHMASRFVRRGASYWNALVATNKLFPLEGDRDLRADRVVVRP